MELQQIFDTVATHLLTQNRKSINEINGNSGVCAYRGNNGASCAVGCLIPDAAYKSSMETKTIHYKQVKDVLRPVIGRMTVQKVALLWDLQKIHDRNDYPVSSWRSLRHLANKRGLIFTPLTEGA